MLLLPDGGIVRDFFRQRFIFIFIFTVKDFRRWCEPMRSFDDRQQSFQQFALRYEFIVMDSSTNHGIPCGASE
jgi:hypothetical protein